MRIALNSLHILPATISPFCIGVPVVIQLICGGENPKKFTCASDNLPPSIKLSEDGKLSYDGSGEEWGGTVTIVAQSADGFLGAINY